MRTIAPSMFVARACVALAVALFVTMCARAQSANTGAIEGRVFDAARGEYLENARITVEGTSLEAFTDTGGFYRLARVPAGAVKIRAFFTGLVAPTETVNVTAGQPTTKDFTLARPGQRTTAGETV